MAGQPTARSAPSGSLNIGYQITDDGPTDLLEIAAGGFISVDLALVSRTVVDLVAGSELAFVEHGSHELKGVPGSWTVFAAQGAG